MNDTVRALEVSVNDFIEREDDRAVVLLQGEGGGLGGDALADAVASLRSVATLACESLLSVLDHNDLEPDAAFALKRGLHRLHPYVIADVEAGMHEPAQGVSGAPSSPHRSRRAATRRPTTTPGRRRSLTVTDLSPSPARASTAVSWGATSLRHAAGANEVGASRLVLEDLMRENEALRGRVRELKLEAAEATAAARDDIDRLTARARTLELQDSVWARENTELKATLDAQVASTRAATQFADRELHATVARLEADNRILESLLMEKEEEARAHHGELMATVRHLSQRLQERRQAWSLYEERRLGTLRDLDSLARTTRGGRGTTRGGSPPPSGTQPDPVSSAGRGDNSGTAWE